MTMEQFEKARELHEESEFVSSIKWLLEVWTQNEGKTKNKLAMMYNEKQSWSGKDYDDIEGFSPELQKRLIKTCQDYYDELMKEFAEV